MSNPKKEFSRIYTQYIDKIYRFIFFKVNSPQIAEDLTSETFLRGWEVFKNGNPKIENISAFLYQIARNLVADFYREKNKIQVISAEAEGSLPDPRIDLEEKAKLDSDLERVKKALGQLNEDYQNAIIWYYIDGLPIQEVAHLLGRTKEATRVLITRAIKTLRKKLDEEIV